MTWPVLLGQWTGFLERDYRTTDVKAWTGTGYSYGEYQYEFTIGAWLVLALHVLVAPAAVVAASYVRWLTAMQTAKVQG
ncbi:hypothetical protein J5Y04_16995 [Kitasatospora sp. RG8]|uniref:hypothetical protein n=1 Tax=Kitasatospora sp. RG8 TaxID=2820815 RepID=UPI001ADF5493|nr:hypothetical protein [Kitasatospora sp. RG8]MBP0451225.1 hypothetical protein [Kitasatospora sp. RG8]